MFYNAGTSGTGIEVVFGNTVEEIPEYLFYESDSSYRPKVTSVTIGENVTSIGSSAFRDCTKLKKIYWNARSVGDFAYNSYVFSYAGSSGDGMVVVFGDAVERIPAYFFDACNVISVSIPDSVTSIGESAFRDCRNLTSITIPDSVTYIGKGAFSDCENLSAITIPDSVTYIGDGAFYGCTCLKAVYITDVAAWCNCTFGRFVGDETQYSNPLYFAKKLYLNGESITDLVVPDGVTNIGYAAFVNCTNLTSITIPDSVTSIDRYAFYGCENLKNVYYRGKLIEWGDITIGDSNSDLLTATISHIHTYNDWIIDKAASCKESGSKHTVCLVCDEVITETIPVTGHKPADNWVIDSSATVYKPGSKHSTCLTCGDTVTVAIPQLKTATPKVKAVNTIKGMKVTWNAVDGAVKYALYKRLGTANSWTYVTTTTATAYSDNNAPYAGSYYVYTVKAYNSAGTPSDYIKANCASVQRVIAPYTYASNTVNGINVTWSKVSGANKYVVLRRLGTGSVWETLCTTTGTSYLDKNVIPGIYYLYSIRAVNNTGYSEYDVNKRVTIKRASYKPDTPTATATNLANGVQVKWNSVTGATKYNVYRRVGGSSSWVLVGSTTGTSLVDKGVTNGKYYVYSIRAINSTGYSAFDTSKTDTIQPITAPTPKLVNKSNGVHISWNKVEGATKYNVYRRAAGSSTWVYVGSTTSLGGLDKGVVKGNYYAYSIRAINGTGYSAYNSSKCAAIKHT